MNWKIIIHDILPILGSLFTLILLIVIGHLYNRFRKLSAILKSFGYMYGIMDEIVAETAADRVLILRTTDDGGVLHPAHPIYMEILHESWVAPLVTIKRRYRRVTIDGEYIRMLGKLIVDKEVSLTVKDMPDCFLRRAYIGMDVKYSKVYYLNHNRQGIYYCSISTTQERGLNNSKDLDTIHVGLSKLRTIFKYI